MAEAPPLDDVASEFDLVICADGVNSASRAERAAVFQPSIDRRKSKFMWLGTDLVFEAFTFHIVETEWGVFQLHCYPYDDAMSTFIVETDPATWRRAGLDTGDAVDLAPGESDEGSIEFCRSLFADVLDGHELIANNSKWLQFNTIHNQRWHDGNVVLLGDAAHTAHFSIGSRYKAGDGGRDRARLGVQEQRLRQTPSPRCCRVTKTSVEQGLPPPSVRHRPAWNGSRTYLATWARVPTSSRSIC